MENKLNKADNSSIGAKPWMLSNLNLRFLFSIIVEDKFFSHWRLNLTLKVKFDCKGQGLFEVIRQENAWLIKELDRKINVGIYIGSWIIRAQSFQFELNFKFDPRVQKSLINEVAY